MNKEQMSAIIADALNRYPWRDSLTLPDLLANAITSAQVLNDAGAGAESLSLKAANMRLGAEIDKLRAEIKGAANTLNDRDAEILNLRNLKRLYEQHRHHEQTHLKNLDNLLSDLKNTKRDLEVANEVLEKQRMELGEVHADLKKADIETERLIDHLDRAEGHKNELRSEIAKLKIEIKDAAKRHTENLDHLRKENSQLGDDRYLFKCKLEAAESDVANLRKEIRQHLDAIERLTKDRREMKGKLEELTSVADEFEKENRELRNDMVVATRKLEELRAASPHIYQPSVARTGNCFICGNAHEAPQHDTAQWKVRAEKAEKEAENAVAAVKLAQKRAVVAEGDAKDALFRAEVAEKRADTHEALVAAVKQAIREGERR